MPMARFALFVVFFWFGWLKVIGLSPASGLVQHLFEQTISFILKYDAGKKEIVAEPYSPPDINYTIHDGCDHENGECFEDYPDSIEYQEVQLAESYSYAVRNLQALEQQVRQQRIANNLNGISN